MATTLEQKTYLRELRTTGKVPAGPRPDFNGLGAIVQEIEKTAIGSNGHLPSIENTIALLSGAHLELAELTKEESQKASTVEVTRNEQAFPPLPKEIAFSADASVGACKWLDEYVQISKQWSPRGYEHFHTTVGVWVLSGINARRTRLAFGPNGEYTPLFVALVAPTSQYAKSTTAGIGKKLLRKIGLDWLMCSDIITPQKLISNMAGLKRLPTSAREWDRLTSDKQEKKLREFAMSGQVIWYYDEFGQQLEAMTAKTGVMTDFKGMLRRMDDCDMEASNDTITRDLERIESPYLALCANLTQVDIQPYAGRDARFWRDGFFARFAFAVSPQEKPDKGRFPDGDLKFPSNITKPLTDWHDTLKMPQTYVTPKSKDEQGNTTEYEFTRDSLPRQDCTIDPIIADAFYRYSDALSDMIYDYHLEALAGNYVRLPKKALRLAILFASLENKGHIELRHWAKGQEIAEIWRQDLHTLYQQVNTGEISEASYAEDELLRIIRKLHKAQEQWPTAREIARYYKRYDTVTLRAKLRGLVQAEVLRDVQDTRTIRYEVREEEKKEG
jgi:hypothetical protein